jgi:hypothetical protein
VIENVATASLERWCQLFGPCPTTLQQQVARMPDLFATIQTSGNYRVLRSGFLGGRSYTFERDRLVGAQTWDDTPFGACAERMATTYSARPTVPSSEPRASCGVVPARDYTSGEPCRCKVEARKPTLVDGNQGPPLHTSLDCLYELGVAARLCQRTLSQHRDLVVRREEDAKAHARIALDMRRARGSAPPSAAEKVALEQAAFRFTERLQCGGTAITWPFQGASATCRYDSAGSLSGLRWGRRYVSDGFAACSR